MKRRTQDDWRQLIQQQAASNQSVAEFCQQHGVAQSNFYKRKSQLKTSVKSAIDSSFIKIKQPTASPALNASIEIEFQQSQLRLPVGISPHWLAEFIKALA